MKIFSKKDYSVLPQSAFTLFSDLGAFSFPDAESEHGKAILSLADEALNKEIPQLYASKFRRFFTDGNRTEFEKSYFGRRDMLQFLLFGELVAKNGKYLEKLIDVLWLILEETTWILPAHNGYEKSRGHSNDSIGNEYTGDAEYLDLFSAETGAYVAAVYYFLKDEISKVAPIINERILYELKRRILHPYLHHRDFHWMALNGVNHASNWTTWIVSNVLTVAAFAEEDVTVKQQVVVKALECLDEFVDTYDTDGGCSEGPSYWGQAGAALFSALEVIYDMTGGECDFFDHPLIYQIMDYIRKVHLTGFAYTNFADSPPFLNHNGLIHAIRMGERTHNPMLKAFALENSPQYFIPRIAYNVYRNLKDLCLVLPETREPFIPNEFDLLENLQVAVHRSNGGFICGVKGGHNGEIHNHNDVGNLIVMYNKTPLLIDIGSPTYTRFTFGAARYTVFPINSNWHNLPEINGFTQQTGQEFHCNRFTAEKGRTVIEYQSAYEKEANVSKCVRDIRFSRNEVIIEESIDFSGDTAIFRYYMAENPTKTAENTYVFQSGVTMVLPPESRIVPVPFVDVKIAERWETNTLYCAEVTVPAGDRTFAIHLTTP